MGIGPGHGAPDGPFPDFETLANKTFDAFGDLDASPTKAWVVHHREDEGMQKYFDYAFGRLPAEELYDNRNDPDHLVNLAANPEYSDTREQLSKRLMKVLTENADPRVTGDGSTFDKPPFVGEFRRPAKKKK